MTRCGASWRRYEVINRGSFGSGKDMPPCCPPKRPGRSAATRQWSSPHLRDFSNGLYTASCSEAPQAYSSDKDQGTCVMSHARITREEPVHLCLEKASSARHKIRTPTIKALGRSLLSWGDCRGPAKNHTLVLFPSVSLASWQKPPCQSEDLLGLVQGRMLPRVTGPRVGLSSSLPGAPSGGRALPAAARRSTKARAPATPPRSQWPTA